MTVRRVWAGLAAALALASSASVAAIPVWSPTPAADAVLDAGRVFVEVLAEPDDRHGIIHSAIDIAAPRERVWRVMTDCTRMPVLMRTSCRVVSGDMRAGSDVREQVTARNFIFPPMHNVVRIDYTEPSLMRFRRTGGDFRTLEGEWRLVPIDNGAGTRVIYVSRVAVNLPIPSPLMRQSLRHDVPQMLLALRREAMSGR
jgi:hypothetical protein